MGLLPGSPDDGTLDEVVAAFELEGYRGQVAARPAGHVLCVSCHMESDAADLEVDALRRIEGVSDPADMLAIAAVVCPVCNTQGTLVLGYGPEAGPDDAEVLARLGDVPD
jgi:Zn ribbon nucleic-acid-binding protein